ncbi:dUTP diphosphatase [Mycoplasma sp. Pen4]|uniref:dUTP diphosphatase n=1 Tax=Mycoplasma sp. Pen4 TaxID=640330 RepID=UPI001654477E|nr:dUTP diphosphatase [Mycoplasma sp. Pen4]QNM93599.1 dUTP diphosphatase [Mycoplasma sp. Pen4]
MNLTHIFQMQKELDEKIAAKSKKANPDLTENDFLVQKTLALVIEAGEFINEVQSFKYWKLNKNIDSDALTEEFADLLHFLVNFAYLYELSPIIEPVIASEDINIQFQQLIIATAELMKEINKDNIKKIFELALGSFVMLGYDYDDLYQAYLRKNTKNHLRIKNNY